LKKHFDVKIYTGVKKCKNVFEIHTE